MKDVDADRRIRVLSLNCWGLKWISKAREVRMRSLGDSLGDSQYDVICLQECWVYEDFLYIQAKVRHFLPYSHYFFSGFCGSGLAIFSRWPILSTSIFPFHLNGRPTAVWRGDWYAAKGVGTALIRHFTGMFIEVFNTHFHAEYGKGVDTYMHHRIAQGWDLAKLLRGAAERGRFVIAAGDLNCRSDSIIHTLVVQHGLVADSWEACHPPLPTGSTAPSFSEEAKVQLYGITCDSPLNDFTPPNLASTSNDPHPKRIDYIFTSHALIEEANVVFTDRIPVHNINYSDHYGVSITLYLPQDIHKPTGYLSLQLFNSIRDIALHYIIRQEKYIRIRIGHFFLSLVVCISMLASVWFVKAAGSIFVMMFFSTMCSWCGVLDGAIGFIWGRWELRTIKEFEQELDLARIVYGHEPDLVECP